jgi:hypothetical protein
MSERGTIYAHEDIRTSCPVLSIRHDLLPTSRWEPQVNFKAVATEIAELVEKKSKAYGDSFGKSGEILKLLYPDGIKPDQYTNALAIVRIVDKLFRIATDKDAFGEDPWRDIVGYGLNAAARKEPEPKKPEVVVKLQAMSKTVPQASPVWIGTWNNFSFEPAASSAVAAVFTPEQVKAFQDSYGKYFTITVFPQNGY